MGYLCQKSKKMGVTVIVSDMKRMKNYPDFDKLGLYLKITNVSRRRQTALVVFCRSGSVA